MEFRKILYNRELEYDHNQRIKMKNIENISDWPSNNQNN